jgi:hypothetical protein
MKREPDDESQTREPCTLTDGVKSRGSTPKADAPPLCRADQDPDAVPDRNSRIRLIDCSEHAIASCHAGFSCWIRTVPVARFPLSNRCLCRLALKNRLLIVRNTALKHEIHIGCVAMSGRCLEPVGCEARIEFDNRRERLGFRSRARVQGSGTPVVRGVGFGQCRQWGGHDHSGCDRWRCSDVTTGRHEWSLLGR